MASGKCEIDPTKIQTIRECLEKQFVDVKFSQSIRPTFTFHNGVRKLSWLLVMNEEFLHVHRGVAAIRSILGRRLVRLAPPYRRCFRRGRLLDQSRSILPLTEQIQARTQAPDVKAGSPERLHRIGGPSPAPLLRPWGAPG